MVGSLVPLKVAKHSLELHFGTIPGGWRDCRTTTTTGTVIIGLAQPAGAGAGAELGKKKLEFSISGWLGSNPNFFFPT